MVKYILLDDEVNSDTGERDSPGQRLRAAREQQELDIKTVAKKLHMHEEAIIALEDDDYEKFPAPIYVSGFLRNYARLLKLSPEPIVEAYESLGKEAPPILSEITSKIPRRRRKGVESWAGYLAVGGVLLIFLVWMMPSNKRIINDEIQVPQESPPEISSPPSPITENEQVPDTESPPAAAASSSTATNTTAEDSSESPASDSPPTIPSDTLVLHFTQDSWVEITDSTGRRLFYAMGKAGETSTLLGTAPFSILLGYSPGVSLEYNGKIIDQSPYVRQDVARFKLGKSN
jgi:cytoskeleton protein RodZ